MGPVSGDPVLHSGQMIPCQTHLAKGIVCNRATHFDVDRPGYSTGKTSASREKHANHLLNQEQRRRYNRALAGKETAGVPHDKQGNYYAPRPSGSGGLVWKP